MKQDKWSASPVYGGSQKSEAHRLCEERLEQALEKLKEQDAFIKQVATTPALHGIVVSVTPATATMPEFVDVLFNGTLARMPKMIEEPILPFDSVLIVQGGGLVGKSARLPSVGRVVAVKQVISDEEVEIELGGQAAVVRHLGTFPIEEGDRVCLDTTMTLILEKVPAPPAPVAALDVERVLWTDIGGQYEAKAALEEAIIWPKKYGHILKAYGQRESKGVLMWGPPGCGKTLIAKAVATELAEQGNPGFISVRGPELMNPYVGETERLIRQLFESARKHHEEHGTRAVIFIDEADSCLGHRGHRLHSDISVPAFLVEMDGISGKHQPLVILATNRPEDLDEAIVRPGRVDRKIEVKRPSREDVVALFGMYLSKRLLEYPTADAMSEACTTEMERSVLLWDKRSGALIASLVDRATAFALKRDIAEEATKPTGIRLGDCVEAIRDAVISAQLGGR